MDIAFDLGRALEALIRNAASGLEAFGPDFEPDIKPADPRFGDFQANGVLPFAKRQRTNPRALATELAEAIMQQPEYDAGQMQLEIAGPGFINFSFNATFLTDWVKRYRDEAALREAANELYGNSTIVVDYPSPNTAKQMHIGHLRPMVIGEAVQRLLRFCGAKIVRDNHIGDWGTNFGTLIMAIKREGFDLEKAGADALAQIEELYKQGSLWEKDDPSLRDKSRNELVKLQNGDPENVGLWKRINAISETAFTEIYQQLGVEPDVTLGESFYRDKVTQIYEELTECGLATESEGALVVFHPEHPRFKEQPFIIRKKDGASNYASTDLATILYRVNQFQAGEIVYVTDGRQQDHFQQLFLTAQKWFEKSNRALPKLSHVWFGTILGEDGKAIKTRSGEPIRLRQLLQESIDRAYKIVSDKATERGAELTEDEMREIARVVGLGAIRYADLSQNRTSDYVFAWDKLLSFDGNTAPYLLYAVARIHSIFRKAAVSPESEALESAASTLETPEEIALARKLVSFPAVVSQTLNELRPHFLCTWLFELAGEFSRFYNANKILGEPEATCNRRLVLCARTMRVLETGLHLLGIETLERM